MRQHRGIEQEEIRHVGQQAAMQHLVVAAARRRRGTRSSLRGAALVAAAGNRCGCTGRNSKGRFCSKKRRTRSGRLRQQLRRRRARVRQALRRRHLRHGDLMIEAALGRLERGRHVEDLLRRAEWRRRGAWRRCLPSQAAVDLVDDRRIEIAAAQEVGVQRMHHAALRPSRPRPTSAWPSTWPPNTCGLPMSRLSPRNRLISSRSSVITLIRSSSS